MKKIFVIALSAAFFIGCKEETKKEPEVKVEENVVEYATFGDVITAEEALSQVDMLAKYEALQKGDTIDVKFKSSIEEICQKKGCWMSIDLGNEQTAFVKFKDYGFFVPKNAHNQEVVVNGKAFVDVISVDELKHYAKDEGKSQEAIDSITEPQVTYSFMADGVLIAKK